MMTLLSYKVVHIFGLFLIFTGLGGRLVQAMLGSDGNAQVRKLTGIAHGVGLLLVLISGFGALAKLGIGFPGWVIAKLAIWLVIGGIIVVIRKNPGSASWLWWVLPLLGGFAGYLALYKPF